MRRDLEIFKDALGVVTAMVLRTGTEEQIALLWGILKTAQEEFDKVVPLKRREDRSREEMQ